MGWLEYMPNEQNKPDAPISGFLNS